MQSLKVVLIVIIGFASGRTTQSSLAPPSAFVRRANNHAVSNRHHPRFSSPSLRINMASISPSATSPAIEKTTGTESKGRKQQAVIVGGGPAGAVMAIFLAQAHGLNVDLFEGRERDTIAASNERSYNVVFMQRGLDAMKAAGIDLAEEAGDKAISITGNVRHHSSPEPTKAFRGGLSVCRGDAAVALLRKAGRLDNVNVHFGCQFSAVDLEQRIATFTGPDGASFSREYDILVGADGVNSRVRAELDAKVPDFTYHQRKDPISFKTIDVPMAGWRGAMESWKTSFHVYNSKIGCILAPPRGEGRNSFESHMKTPQDVRKFFDKWYPDVFGPDGPSHEVAQAFLNTRPARLTSTYCSRLSHENVVLIGDAAHSMWSSLGQGAQAALEDCRVLSSVLRATETKTEPATINIPAALEVYNQWRLEDALAVTELSEEGMGGARSNGPAFVAQMMLFTALNKTLGRRFPKTFGPPSLTKVSNPDSRYSEVLRGVKREARVIKTLAKIMTVAAVTVVAQIILRHR